MRKNYHWLKNNFKLLKTNGDWAVYINRPIYREIRAYGNYYIVNTSTGENCGQYVALYCTLFDENGKLLDNPIYDINCYEVVEND